MADTTKIPLVSTEISALWNSYMGETLFSCKLKYFLNRVDDSEIRTILQQTLDLTNKYINALTNIFTQEKLPIPEGFTDSNVNINVPRLYTDNFYLQYVGYSSRVAMRMYSLYLNRTARSDIRDHFSKCSKENIDLFNSATELGLSKGIFIRAPHVEVPKQVQYIKSKSFMLDWFGKKRPLLTSEISGIFSVVNDTRIGKALVTGFGQVCKDKKVSDHLLKFITFATKQNDDLSSLLSDEGIPIPSPSDSYITDSTVSPFSDKLMLNKILLIYRVRISNLGMALTDILRSDLKTVYMKYLDEAIKHAQDVAGTLIDNRWLEEPPQAINHENLVGV